MKRISLALVSFGVVLLCLTGQATVHAQTVTLLSQDFEDTATFFAGVDGFVGSAADSGGRWGPFDFQFSRISETVGRSGNQSLISTRGGTTIGRTDETILSNRYELSYWMRRATVDSVNIMMFGNAASVNVSGVDLDEALGLGTFVKGNGTLNYWDSVNDAWVASGGVVPVGEWNRVRLDVDEDLGTYDLYLMPEGGTESLVTTVTPALFPAGIDRARANPQGLLFTETFIDDVLITYESDPSFADFDSDGDVDGSDFLAWQRGQSSDPLSASDLAGWERYYGASGFSLLSASTATVPEPGTCLLAFMALGAFSLFRNRG